MLKPFTKEGRFECGLDENPIIAGKLWAFTAIVGNPCRLGVSVANEPGYLPIPQQWCHADNYDELTAHADELNLAEGHDPRAAMSIVASSMAAGKVR